MSVPRDIQARRFYRSARERFEDAQILLKAERSTGAIYLAGYSAECMLKALVLSTVSDKDRATEYEEITRGSKSHSFESLKARYQAHGGPVFPATVVRSFSRINSWTTRLRYDPATARTSEAELFLQSVWTIIEWAEGRL